MAREHILVVDNEKDILELVQYNLSKNGYKVTCVTTGEEALKAARAEAPNLILLDLMLPGVDGLEVCRLLMRDGKTRHIPIIMLTAKGEEADIVTGLELGADDYVAKPFSPGVLLARVRAVLGRGKDQEIGPEALLCVGDLTIHPGRHEVLAQGKPIKLTHTEFGILHLLAARPGWVFTRYQIVDGTRGQNTIVTDRSVDVHIVSLRRKLGAQGSNIETVRGVGYRFKDR